MISPPSATTANSASELGKSDRVVSAFCIIISKKGVAVGAELTVLLMMGEAEQAAPCCAVAVLASWVSQVGKWWGERTAFP